jgi:hypothetical protein
MTAIAILLGWLLGVLVAALVDNRAKIAAWLRA